MLTRSQKRVLLIIPVVLSLLLVACGAGSSSSKGNITIGSKNDADSQLLASFYGLLLSKHGYNVTYKLALGQSPVVFSAIQSGAIQMYPEFTGDGLFILQSKNQSVTFTTDAQQVFSQVKSGYESQFKLTWLDPAYNLNDSYAICTSQQEASTLHATSLADLAPVANTLVISTQQDGVDAAIKPVQQAYGYTFKSQIQQNETLGYDTVLSGQAQLNVCYTTDPLILSKNFVVLKDPKNVFPIYNPAPLVRDDFFSKHSDIQGILQPLESKLTTDEIVQLIKKVSQDHQPVQQVAQQFLQQQGLL
jgi:osmoprotectant transport system substrate-binding protein